MGLGSMALGAASETRRRRGRRREARSGDRPRWRLPGLPHFPAKAKRVIYLFQSGRRRSSTCSTTSRRSARRRGVELPDSIRMGQRITTMTSGQKSLPVAPSIFKFAQHGESGAWLSELLPHTAKIVDDISIIRSMQTEAINHDPAITFVQTGSQLAGRPSMGSWIAYGLGSMNQRPAGVRRAALARANRPAALRPALGQRIPPQQVPGGEAPRAARIRCSTSPTPSGCSTRLRRQMLDDLGELNDAPPRTDRRPRDPHPDRPVRAGLPDADVGPRTDRPVAASRNRSSTCTAPTSRSPAPTPPTACWPAGWPSGACGSSSSITWAGTSTATCRTRSARSAATPTSPPPH